MPKLKIGVALNNEYKPQIGGAFSYYASLLRALDRYDFDPEIEIVFVDFGNYAGGNFRKQVLDINLPTLKRKSISLMGSWAFSRLAGLGTKKGEVTDKGLTTGYLSKLNKKVEHMLAAYGIDLLYYIVPSVHSLNYPYIITHWDLGHKSMFAFPEVSMNHTFHFRYEYHITVLQKAFAIFVESALSKKELGWYEGVNPARVYIVPMFPGDIINIDVQASELSAVLQKFSLSEKKFFFYPAQFWSHKNHYNLIHAFKLVVEKYPGTRLVLCGQDKGNLDYIKSVITELELSEAVVIPGFVSNEELFCFYRSAAALIMPTMLGPTNMPLLEAYEIGCQVLCSDLEGHRELMGDVAVYFDPLDPVSIATAMNEKLETPVSYPPGRGKFGSIHAVRAVEKNLLALIPLRKMFGFNFSQY